MISYIYFIKVMLCSAILLGYYFVALRNKAYHQYNRLYLLLSTIAAWLIPSLSFNFMVEQKAVSAPIYTIINYASSYSDKLASANAQHYNEPNIFTLENLALLIIACISLYFLLVLLSSFYKIYLLKNKYQAHQLEHCTIYLTNEKYTPYSFLNHIFWNQKIALDSKLGQQILQHELVHIKEKHSWDKIFIQLNLIVGWFNPFLWLVKAELEIIHEFIADEQSIPNADVSEFATMILSVNEVNKHVPLTNPFFFSPIKRRLQMLTSKKSLQFSYLQRLLALPVLVFLVVLLSLKSKQTFAQIQKLLPNTFTQKEVATKSSTNKPNNINLPQQNSSLKTTVTKIQPLVDSAAQTIDSLQKQYQAMELQYKKEAAIAKERKKLMELIQKQDLPEERIVEVFKILVKADTSTLAKAERRQMQQALVAIIGKEKISSFLKETNQIHQETEAALSN